MTTTDIAVIPTVDVEPQELSKTEARALDKRIKSAIGRTEKQFKTLETNMDELSDLIRTSIEGKIHVALGIKSWDIWAKSTLRIDVPDKLQRKEFTKILAVGGASTRAISAVLGVSQMTSVRDLAGEEGLPDTVKGTNDVEKPRNNGKAVDPEPEPLDAEFEEIPDVPLKSGDIVTSFNDEMAYLVAAQGELTLLTEEDKWAGARKRVGTAHLNNLGEVIKALEAIRDDLMGDGS